MMFFKKSMFFYFIFQKFTIHQIKNTPAATWDRDTNKQQELFLAGITTENER